jgi:hypothetical protein
MFGTYRSAFRRNRETQRTADTQTDYRARLPVGYSRDDAPDSFPPFTEGPTRGTSVSCWELFETFVNATKPAGKTVTRWRAVFLEMQREFAEVGAEGMGTRGATRLPCGSERFPQVIRRQHGGREKGRISVILIDE